MPEICDDILLLPVVNHSLLHMYTKFNSITFIIFRTRVVRTTFYLIQKDIRSFVGSEERKVLEATLAGYNHKMIIISKDLADEETWV